MKHCILFATLTLLLLAATTTAIAQTANLSTPNKTLFFFKTPTQAKAWTTAAGFTLVAVGGYLGGKAEMHQRYHGTTSNDDNFHITRDAGLIVTGLGAGSLGASITIGEKPRVLDILWKAAAGAIVYRIVAQATYNATKPNP